MGKQIYDKPIRGLMRDMVDDMGVKKGDILSNEQVLQWFNRRYPKIKNSTINTHLIRMSTNAQSRVHYNAKPDGDDLSVSTRVKS